MKISQTVNNDTLTIALAGRLDTVTAPELETVVNESLGGVRDLTMDLGELVYISSAGLRVLLSAQKRMNKQGKMVVRHVNETVMEVFEITGFADILTIES